MSPSHHRHVLYRTQSDYNDAPSCGYGSFHRCYRLKEPGSDDSEPGRLVAVGVVDILPTCVNSSYFVWDPALKSLSLGVFSCLEEIHMVRDLEKYFPLIHHYYIGELWLS